MADLSLDDVQRLANLAKLDLTTDEQKKLVGQLSQTIEVVEQLGEINTKGVGLSSQVTGLTNVVREDEVDKERMFTQEEALSGAKRSYQGFFVVKRIIE